MSDLLANKLKEDAVVPDVLEQLPEGIEMAKIVYDNGIETLPGFELTPLQVKNQPKVSWAAEKDNLYTLIMTDPDVPSRKSPKRSQIKHWMVINIPGNEVEKGHLESEYFGSGPERGSGLHRYVFLIYKQENCLSQRQTIKFCELEGRFLFNTAEFAKNNNLGNPIAANYFQAQYDDSVPAIIGNFTKLPVVFKNICPLLNYKFSEMFRGVGARE